MKKKKLVISLIVVLAISGHAVTACNEAPQDKPGVFEEELYVHEKDETKPAFLGQEGLYVNGKEVKANLIFVERENTEFVELPLIAILDALDYPVTWIDETKAEIEINETLFFAKLDTMELVEKDHELGLMTNYIHAVPGNPWGYVFVRDGDIYVDQDILEIVLFHDLNIPATVSIKFEQKRVDIRLNNT